jgi:hypothetical protein
LGQDQAIGVKHSNCEFIYFDFSHIQTETSMTQPLTQLLEPAFKSDQERDVKEIKEIQILPQDEHSNIFFLVLSEGFIDLFSVSQQENSCP